MRKKGWLKAWSITINGDDQTENYTDELRRVLSKCRFFSFVLAELAIDFSPSLGVDRGFVRRHAFSARAVGRIDRGGKGHLDTAPDTQRNWSAAIGRSSLSLPGGVGAASLNCSKRHQITDGATLADISFVIFPKHFRFVEIRWKHVPLLGAPVRSTGRQILKRRRTTRPAVDQEGDPLSAEEGSPQHASVSQAAQNQ